MKRHGEDRYKGVGLERLYYVIPALSSNALEKATLDRQCEEPWSPGVRGRGSSGHTGIGRL